MERITWNNIDSRGDIDSRLKKLITNIFNLAWNLKDPEFIFGVWKLVFAARESFNQYRSPGSE
jgi:hypothetical protein